MHGQNGRRLLAQKKIPKKIPKKKRLTNTDTSKPGDYEIKYSVADSSKNESEVKGLCMSQIPLHRR